MAMVRYMAWACWGLGGLALAGAVIEADPALIAPAAAGAVVGVLLMALDRLLAILDGARAALERMAGGETAAEGGGSSQGDGPARRPTRSIAELEGEIDRLKAGQGAP